MKSIDTIVIGGSQAGLAMSRSLLDRGVEHVVLERGRIGERWRTERWNSLRLLTPNWMSRLPGYHYEGDDPHGFMTKDELVGYLEGYARSFSAPVEEATAVVAVEPGPGGGFVVRTDRGDWSARRVVVATGHSDVPAVPRFARSLPDSVCQVVTTRYKEPADLPEGGVLVVGASATGVQLAEELHRSGRPVTLAVGKHTRLPRRYRGRDILHWFDAMGILDERANQVHDLAASLRQPSFQLVGRPDGATLDLGVLQSLGVRLVGTAIDVEEGVVELCDDLQASTLKADAKLVRLLDRIDAFVRRAGLEHEVLPAEPLAPVHPAPTPKTLDLAAAGISTVLWATGFRRNYDWLRLPVLDRRGDIRHDGGVTPIPGLYVLGMRFQTRRNSSFLDGVGADAQAVADHLAASRFHAAA
ncbi:MAG: NAD(P)-binding domain-containing protein [Acidobacteria bacterium]|nr:NAD(P)-binding domain-containing protein [Acidobacteriota bacterium]